MIQFRSAALLAALIVLPSASYAQSVDPDAAAQSGVHKEAGKDIDARVDADADANANVGAGGKTQAEIDAEADANAGAQVGDDKPQQQNQSQ